MVIDPVCKMQIDENSAVARREHKGKTYYFCAFSCKDAFDRDPGKYIEGTTENKGASDQRRPLR